MNHMCLELLATFGEIGSQFALNFPHKTHSMNYSNSLLCCLGLSRGIESNKNTYIVQGDLIS